MMRNDSFFCNGCERFFDDVKNCYETHGLDTPPYEQYGVCPRCGSDNFCEFNPWFKKFDIVEDLLWEIMRLNKLSDGIGDLFGLKVCNGDLCNTVSTLAEKIFEMFDFIKVDMQKKILKLNDENELKRILIYLKGGL